jgi:hypothetical protein
MLASHWTTTWVLFGMTACVAAPDPVNTTCDAVREPEAPLDIVSAPDRLPAAGEQAVAPAPEPTPAPTPTFEPTPVPWHLPKTVVSGSRRGCSVLAVTDPEVLVVYSMIDVYALIVEDLVDHFQTPLPERAEKPPCARGVCQPDAPNAVLIDDGPTHPLDGRAIGFVVPIGSGYWVLPLEQAYREDRCMPDVDAETVEAGHAHLTIRYPQFEEQGCDDGDDETECMSGCFYSGATRYDLFYDAETKHALLVTRTYDEFDGSDEPTPAIELTRERDDVRIDGCKANVTIPWPPS